jgi:hypothetical protein
VRDDHPELRRDYVEPLGDILADPVHLAATAGTAPVAGLDHDLFARQMLGQRATIDTTLPDARRFQRRVGLLCLGLALGQHLLDVFEGEFELIGMGRLLGASPEQGPLQLFDDGVVRLMRVAGNSVGMVRPLKRPMRRLDPMPRTPHFGEADVSWLRPGGDRW